MNTKAKYVVLPGFVRSKNDGQLHAVGAATLMKLYQVNPRDCVVYYRNLEDGMGYKQQHSWKLDLIRLEPRSSGDYSLPEK